MKTLLFFVFAVLATLFVSAQIGMGTTTPNPKAALDISSTTKGLLIPSMTSVQRAFITSPPNGLMVYDTDVNQFYHYDGTTWRKMINSTYWNQSSTRNWVYNSTDSVGIGTSIPTERLDVNGNIRSRDDLLADGRVIATGIVTGSSLQTPGNLVVSGLGIVSGNFTTNGNLTGNSNLSVDGTSLLTGDVTTNNNLIVNNSGATLQLRNGGNVNKGFFQLSGDNVRMGTNSGNSTGNLIIRMNGNDRVQIDPAGDINIEGKITKTAVTGFKNLVPLCYGKVNNGVLQSGTANVTVSYVAVTPNRGYYKIFCAGINSNSVIMSTCNIDFLNDGSNTDTVVSTNASYSAPGEARVTTIFFYYQVAQLEIKNRDFSFVIY